MYILLYTKIKRSNTITQKTAHQTLCVWRMPWLNSSQNGTPHSIAWHSTSMHSHSQECVCFAVWSFCVCFGLGTFCVYILLLGCYCYYFALLVSTTASATMMMMMFPNIFYTVYRLTITNILSTHAYERERENEYKLLWLQIWIAEVAAVVVLASASVAGTQK